MSDDTKNPFKKPHFLIGAAVLAAIGSAIGALIFDSARTAVEDVVAGPVLSVRVIPATSYEAELNPIVSALVPDDGPKIEALENPEYEGKSWFAVTHAWSDVAAGVHSVRLELRTQSQGQVIIEKIVPRILSRAPARPGWFIADGACGGVLIRLGRLDLDADVPQVVIRDTETGRPMALFVTEDDTEIVQIESETAKDRIEWVLDISYSAPGGPGVVTVDSAGEPFKISALIAARAYAPWYDDDSRSVVRMPEWDNGIVMC